MFPCLECSVFLVIILPISLEKVSRVCSAAPAVPNCLSLFSDKSIFLNFFSDYSDLDSHRFWFFCCLVSCLLPCLRLTLISDKNEVSLLDVASSSVARFRLAKSDLAASEESHHWLTCRAIFKFFPCNSWTLFWATLLLWHTSQVIAV